MRKNPKFEEGSKAWLRDELQSVVNQPTSPAILERINREQEILRELSQKTVTELTGDEALRLISGRQLTYAQAPQYFEHWWKSIDPATQQEINVTAEDFEDLSDYQWRCFTAPGGWVMNASKETLGIKSLYAQMQAGMPKIDEEQFTTLWIDAVRRRKVLKRGRERSPVKSYIDEYVSTTRQALYTTFGIAANRPTGEQKRDRLFSKRRYQGLHFGEIAREWNRGHRKSNLGVSAAAVPKAIQRYRKKREPVMWLLRVWIYRSNFPKLTARTCPKCDGKGEIYFADKWLSWRNRRVDKQDWRSVPKDDPEPPCPPSERCDLCEGTGKRSVGVQQ